MKCKLVWKMLKFWKKYFNRSEQITRQWTVKRQREDSIAGEIQQYKVNQENTIYFQKRMLYGLNVFEIKLKYARRKDMKLTKGMVSCGKDRFHEKKIDTGTFKTVPYNNTNVHLDSIKTIAKWRLINYLSKGAPLLNI